MKAGIWREMKEAFGQFSLIIKNEVIIYLLEMPH